MNIKCLFLLKHVKRAMTKV